ncbi:BTAD domain-containing putative transcriptional regulator [Terrabacter sp. NPDC000476]|uniref:AfsR/SARP family transcriptional regulator n=1 Tax=Terrabacter sp. NPDC000476 TaxID=3154258 RepID=UPI00332028A2
MSSPLEVKAASGETDSGSDVLRHDRLVLDVRLLGPVRLLRDGRPVALGGAKQRAVLALLALESPRAVAVTTLVDAVWGDAPPASARNAVQVYVSGLRTAFGTDDARIERVGDTYRLVGAGIGSDVGRFTEQVAEGRAALRSSSAERAAALLEHALRSWDGTPFAGLEDLPVGERSRRLVEEARATAQVELVDALLRLRRPADAAVVAEALVGERPLDEHAWTLLASAQYHAGRQAAALATCRRLRRVLAEELGVDPSPPSLAVEAAILAQTLQAPPSAGGGAAGAVPGEATAADADAADPAATDGSAGGAALPALPDPFVGRDTEVEHVSALLAAARVVTLTGFGGLGKTTVATAVARRLRPSRPAVHFCDLSAELSWATAVDRVCRVLALEPTDDPVATLAGVATGTLVVLDNAEQVADVGRGVGELLRGTGLTLLVTSRRPLRVAGEHVVRLEPLPTAAGPDGGPSPAARLFLAHAERVRAGAGRAPLERTEALCTLLDGIPLALELAASRTRALTVEQLGERLRRSPVGGAASGLGDARRTDLPGRQAGLAVVLDASIELLPPEAVLLLRVLARLGGWASTELVEQIHDAVAAGTPPAAGPDFLDALEDLVDVGLAEVDGAGRVRLRTPVRDHVLARRDPSVDEAVGASVGDHVEDLVVATAPLLHGPAAPDGIRRLSHDHDAVLAALGHAIAADDRRRAHAMTLGLGRYWLLTGRLVEGRRWLDAARGLDHDGADRIRLDLLAGTYGSYVNDADAVGLLEDALARADAAGLPVDRLVVNGACCLAAMTAHLGDVAAAERWASEAAGLARRSGEPALVSLARDLAAHVASYTGNAEFALEASLAGITDARRAGDRFDLVNLLSSAAENLLDLGRGDEAVHLTDEAFALTRDLDVGPVVAHVLMMRGLALAGVERAREARGCLLEALRMAEDRYPDRFIVGAILTALAVVAAQEGDDVEAARLWGSGDAVFADEGAVPASTAGAFLRASLGVVAQRLGAERLATLHAVGAGAPHDVVARLLGQTGVDGVAGSPTRETGRAVP